LVTAYDIVTVPAATPVTTPEADTVAREVLLEDHVPPEVASERAVVDPTHTVLVPVMPATVGRAFTVTGTLELDVQLEALVTV
jgi:hypothetical protein